MMIDESEALRALADSLLPGGEGFPPASETGMMPMLAVRLRAVDSTLPARLSAAIAAQGPLPDNAAAWREATARLEAVEPKMFENLRKYAYLSYYEQPLVIDAIRALGLLYHLAPLPEGYPTEPFNIECDAPRHERGCWIATDAVQPVDVSKLELEPVR
jgi:hypothetical protein